MGFSVIGSVEHRVLFPVVRLMCFVCAVLFLLAVFGGLYATFDVRTGLDKHISFESVEKGVFGEPDVSMGELKMPKNILALYDGDINRVKATLSDRMSRFGTRKAAQGFLNGLSKLGLPKEVNQLVSLFVNMIAQAVNKVVRWGIMFCVFAVFTGFVLLTLVLLLFAIERNTREAGAV